MTPIAKEILTAILKSQEKIEEAKYQSSFVFWKNDTDNIHGTATIARILFYEHQSAITEIQRQLKQLEQ